MEQQWLMSMLKEHLSPNLLLSIVMSMPMDEMKMYVKRTHYHMWQIVKKGYLLLTKPEFEYTQDKHNII